MFLSQTATALTVTLLAATVPQPQPAMPEVRLEAELVVVTGGFGAGPRLAVRLVNAGRDPITVVGKPSVRRSVVGETATVSFQLTAQGTSKGRLIVPSEAALELVKLLPGEVTVLAFPVLGKDDVPRANAAFLTRVVEGKTRLTVTYEVSEFWGQRFGAWHGKLSTAVARPE